MHLLKKKLKNKVLAAELNDGQIAVIIAWGPELNFVKGNIIIRHRDDLIVVGGECVWLNFFTNRANSIDCFIRVLKPGTKLVV